MIRTQESTGKTVDEAFAKACALLGVQAEDENVSREVLEYPQKTGFLGLKTTPAKVRVSVELPDAPAAVPAKPVEVVAEQPVETAAPVQETAPVAEETNPEMNIPIEDLNLTQRSYNCLKREGIHTIGELVAHTEQDLLDIRNFGMKSIDEVKEKLQSLGLALKASPLGNFDTNNLEGGTFFSPEDE